MTRRSLHDLADGDSTVATIEDIRLEIVDGWPRMVMYFENIDGGLPMTLQSYDDLVSVLGPGPPWIHDFFEAERRKH